MSVFYLWKQYLNTDFVCTDLWKDTAFTLDFYNDKVIEINLFEIL